MLVVRVHKKEHAVKQRDKESSGELGNTRLRLGFAAYFSFSKTLPRVAITLKKHEKCFVVLKNKQKLSLSLIATCFLSIPWETSSVADGGLLLSCMKREKRKN